MLIKFLIAVLILIFSLTIGCSALSSEDISAKSAVVLNAESGEIIFEKDADSKRSMASTTKIMTSVIAIESGRLDNSVEMSASALTEGSSVNLKAGQKLTLETLVYGMLLESGNDAANMTALFLGGSFEGFAEIMNAKAKEIGMTNSSFVTPSGLDADEHYTTAYDMALLGAYAVSNPLFKEICSTKSKTVQYFNPDISLTFSNHNRLLSEYDGVFGIKTGFTKKSGRCLVTACERNGVTLICVTLNAYDDWNDHKKLYDFYFSEIEYSEIAFDDFSEVRLFGAEKSSVCVKASRLVLSSGKSIENIEKKVVLPPIIYAPVYKGQKLGRVEYYLEGKRIYTADIIASEYVACAEESYSENNSIFNYIGRLINRRLKERDKK